MVTASLHGDEWQARRLNWLGHSLEHEAAYARNRDRHGLAVVRARRGPAGCTIGWYFRNDPHVRAVRRARGLALHEETAATS
jgi:hypothetical protein